MRRGGAAGSASLLDALATILAGKGPDALADALALYREHAAAEAALVFVRSSDALRLSCAVPASYAVCPAGVVPPPRSLFDENGRATWFPAGLSFRPQRVLSFAVGGEAEVECVIVLAFDGPGEAPDPDALHAGAVLLGVTALRERDAYFGAVFDEAFVGMAVATPDARIVRTNRRFAEMLGYSPEELANRSFHELTAPEFRSENAAVVRQAMDGAPARIEKPYLHRDGSRVWCDVSLHAERDRDGRVRFVTGVIQNVLEKRTVTEALRRSEERFRSLSACSPTGVFMADVDGNCTYTNARTQEIFGFTLEESLGSGWSTFIHPDDFSRVTEAWRRCVTLNEPFSILFRTLRPDGSSRCVHARSVALTGDVGHPIGHVGSIEDVTERKEFELAIRQSNERVTRILESITDAFFATSHDWRVVYANERAKETLGRLDMVESGLTLWELFPDAVGTTFERAYRYAVDSRIPQHFEEFFPPHGKWYEVHAYPSADGLSIYFRDVTQRRRVEQELREREARFEIVSQATQEMIWDWDLHTGTVWRSNAVETVFSFDRAHVRTDAEWWFEQMHPDDRARVRKSIEAAMESRDAFWSSEYRVLTGDGRWAFVLDRGSILRDEHGRPLRMIGARLDMTERYAAEQELKRSREQSRKVARRLIDIQEEERKRIARDIHDVLGQLLTAIKIDAVSLSRHSRISKAARTRAERISNMVDQTVTTVRGMSSRLRPTVLDDLGLLPALSAELRAFGDRTGIACRLESRVEDFEPRADVATAIFRIVQEALTNVARHASARNARVDVFTSSGAVCVQISDDGCGVSPDRLEHGTSLGVIGMKERAMLIDAELTIDRGAEGGTIVSLRIPVRLEEGDGDRRNRRTHMAPSPTGAVAGS